MVAIQNAADWEIDLAPGLLDQVLDLSPYVNSSSLKASALSCRPLSSTHGNAYVMFVGVFVCWCSSLGGCFACNCQSLYVIIAPAIPCMHIVSASILS
jgi:hypothetical protein